MKEGSLHRAVSMLWAKMIKMAQYHVLSEH